MSALRSTRLRYVSGLEGLVPDHQRPRDPCVLVGEGDGGDVYRAPRRRLPSQADAGSRTFCQRTTVRAPCTNSRRR